MVGQFMVHCILQLKSTFNSEMYIRPGLVPLFSVLFVFLFCSLCASRSFQYALRKKKNSQEVSVPPDRDGFNESILGNCIIL